MKRWAARALTLGALAVASLASTPAAGQSGPTAAAVEFAASEHQRGYQAYVEKRYDQAATHFENAFFSVPNAAELRSAIRARRDAKQYARAATLAALAHRKYAQDGATRRVADDAIAEAKSHVQELTVSCAPECGVVADGKIVTIERATDVRFFLDPGRHELVVSWSDDRSKTLTYDAQPGASEALKTEAPKPSPPAMPPPAASTVSPKPAAAPLGMAASARDADARSAASRKPLAPAFFWTGVGLTAVAAGITVASGVDAQNNPGVDAVRRNCVGQGDACPDYRKGRDAQSRTNVLLGATAGLGLATGVIGLLFTRWHGDDDAARARGGSVQPLVGIGQVGVTGRW